MGTTRVDTDDARNGSENRVEERVMAMIAELLFIAAVTAGWAWLQFTGEVTPHRHHQPRSTDVVR